MKKLEMYRFNPTHWYDANKLNDPELYKMAFDFFKTNKIFYLPENDSTAKSIEFYNFQNRQETNVLVLNYVRWVELMADVWDLKPLDLYEKSNVQILLEFPQLQKYYWHDIAINPFDVARTLEQKTGKIHVVKMGQSHYESFYDCLPPISWGLNYVLQSERSYANCYGFAFKSGDSCYCTNISIEEFKKRQWHNYQKVEWFVPSI